MSSETRWVLAEVVATVVLPAVALTQLTDVERLGPAWGLVVALTPPLVWAGVSVAREGRVSALVVIAVCSILLTGGVGLLELDPRWFAIKEAAVPLLLGLAAMASASTRYAVIPILLDRILDPDAVASALGSDEAMAQYDAATRRATVAAGGVMAASSFLTLGLALWLVKSPTGTDAFGDELGWFTMVSFVGVGVPVTLGMAWVLRGVLITLEDLAGCELERLMRGSAEQVKEPPPGGELE